MPHAISLAFICFALWLLLSGHYVPLMLVLGLLATLFVVAIAVRMEISNREGQPIHLLPMVLSYWPWLLWEIVKANFVVARCILTPALPIKPTLIKVKASQKSRLGKVVYANSITLTPGTVSIDIKGNEIEVHALTRTAAQDLKRGHMDRRVTKFVGSN
ncbi:MAG: Na+/H+ antiporter subunit E [Gammaproteobacteria bacterium]|nr:Na+/H+ antiporter subunit E [Gammaproteobacteria bacterium]